MVTNLPHDWQSFMRNLLEKYVPDCMYCPFTHISYILTFPLLPLWGSSSELSEALSLGLQSSFCPK